MAPARLDATWTPLFVADGDALAEGGCSDDAVVPSPRASHAMTLLLPTDSALVFGGSDGDAFLDDFYVLEPAHYRSDDVTEINVQSFRWKKLVVSSTPTQETSLTQSDSLSDGSLDNKRSSELLSHNGSGRDHHTMHYVPPSPPAGAGHEQRHGMRVLIIGNIRVDASPSAARNDEKAFEMEELRVEEVRIHQPILEAQWVTRRIDQRSIWKPRARRAHCSALVGTQLFCFGGMNAAGAVFYNDIFYFDVLLNQWGQPLTTGAPPRARAHAAMTATRSEDKLFIYGGLGTEYTQLGGLYVFDVADCQWSQIDMTNGTPSTRMNHSLTFVDPNHLLLFGGRHSSVRKNDVNIFDVSTKQWTHVLDNESESSQDEQRRMNDDDVTNTNVGAEFYPPKRTGHTAMLYESTRIPSSQESNVGQILIFGGYAGSHCWLNDLVVLTITTLTLPNETAKAPGEANVEYDQHSPGSSVSIPLCPPLAENSTTRGAMLSKTALNQKRRLLSARSDSPTTGVLADITNHQPPAIDRESNIATDDQAACENPILLKKRKRNDREMQDVFSSVDASQSSNQEAVALQTSIIQLLQGQERTNRAIAKLADVFARDQTARRQEGPIVRQHNEYIRNQLEIVTRRHEASEKELQFCRKDNEAIRAELAAAQSKLYECGRITEFLKSFETNLGRHVETSRCQLSSMLKLLEGHISALHVRVEELFHRDGERTDPDDSPQKYNSMFSDDDRLTPPPQYYPQRVVVGLEKKLQLATTEIFDLKTENEQLKANLKAMESKYKVIWKQANQLAAAFGPDTQP